MAYQWFDSFSRYGTGSGGRTAMLDGLVYARLSSGANGTTGPVADPDPNVSTLCLGVSSSVTNDWESDNRIALPNPRQGVVGFHARYWFNSLPNTNADRPIIMSWGPTTASTTFVYVQLQANGSFQIKTGGGTILADSIIPLISPRTWNHIEMWYDSSNGEGELYINGVKRMEFTDGTLGTTSILKFTTRTGSVSGARFYIKDLGIWDDTGTENNSPAGTVIVSKRNPNADVTLGNWVPSTGSTGYNILAKDAPNDTTYLSVDDNVNDPMQFTFEPIDPDVTSIRAVMSVARMRKIDGGDGNIQQALISDNAVDLGADRPITTTFAYWFDISEISPATSDPWTPTEFNDVVGQVNRTL